jgi:hypothetical protein
LRYCIANASSGSTIHFAPYLHGTISLRESLTFPGSKHLTIQGPGAYKITISGGKNPSANIQVPIDATINISGLSFEDSEMSGDAFLFNEGVLTITNSIIANNKTTVATSRGGGIENRVTGILVVYNTTISNNSAIGSAGSEGGGIYNEGNLTVTHSTFSSNLANGGGNMGWGGGIYNYNAPRKLDKNLSM